ncbi:MAG TPA: hypothetical protein VIE44_14060 [Methylomirabilota bacterium]
MVASFVHKGCWGPWQIKMAVPFERPAVVSRVLGIVHDALDRMPGRYELVLTPQETVFRSARVGPLPHARLRAA